MLRFFIQIPILATPLAAAIDFTKDVQPILNKNCIACHGGVKEAGEVSFIFRQVTNYLPRMNNLSVETISRRMSVTHLMG